MMPDQPTSPSGGEPLLDYSPKHPVQRNYASGGAVAFCAYCGAPLDPFFYFCLRCSTPYKTMEMVTGSVRPTPLTDGERIKRMAPHTWTVFWTYAWVLIGCAVVTIPWQLATGPSPVLYFVSTLAILVTTVIFACIHWRPLAAQLKTIGFLKWEAWAGVGALVPLLMVNFSIHLAVKYFVPKAAQDPSEGLPLLVGVLIFCVFPAVTEEIAFRGLLQYWLEVSLTPWKALLLGAALCAGMHFSVVSFPYLFCVGATLALVRRRTGSLYPGMLIHFLHNFVVIAAFPLLDTLVPRF